MTRILTVFAMLLFALPALAQDRHALVVGIDSYTHVAPLQKARNDARDVVAALDAADFRTELVIDPDENTLLAALALFAGQLNPGDEAVFYFAGHGVEIDGRNYLLPADVPDVPPGQELIVTRRALPVDEVIDAFQARGARLSLLILDACRDNPFEQVAGRSVGRSRGLGRSEPPEGTFIMYSAGAGQSALDALSRDDPERNSVFTRALLPRMNEPGLDLRVMVRQLRSEVRQLARTVGHNQFPAVYDQLDGEFQFIPAAVTPDPAPGPTNDPCAAAATVWASVQNADSIAALESFKEIYGETCPVFAALAGDRLATLRAALAAQPEPTPTPEPAPAPDADRDDDSDSGAQTAATEDLFGLDLVPATTPFGASALQVRSITADSLAATTDLAAQDFIVTADGTRILNLDNLRSQIERARRLDRAALALRVQDPQAAYQAAYRSVRLPLVEVAMRQDSVDLCTTGEYSWQMLQQRDSLSADMLRNWLRTYETCRPASAVRARLTALEAEGSTGLLTRDQQNELRVILYRAEKRLEFPQPMTTGSTTRLPPDELHWLYRYASSENLPLPSLDITRVLAESLLQRPNQPEPISVALENPSMAVYRRFDAQHHRDWQSFRDAQGWCNIASAAQDFTSPMMPFIPEVQAAVNPDGQGGSVRWSLVWPMPFRTGSQVQADVDGQRFNLRMRESGSLTPPLFRGGPSLDSTITRAMRRGQVLRITGPNALTGEEMTLRFSLMGFTAAFTRMASACNRQGTMSWID